MKLTAQQNEIVVAESLRCYPEEAVIAITCETAIPLKNHHADPVNYFSVNEVELDKLNPIALIHSHTHVLGQPRPEFEGEYVDVRIPSKMDLQAQMILDIPFGIVACDGKEVTNPLWFPDLISPVEGREYVPGIFDCFRVVRAYLKQNYNVFVPENPRQYKWWKDNPIEVMRFADFGFREVSEERLQDGDVIVFRYGKHPNHLGVYTGDGNYVHHMTNKLSKKDDYSRDRHLAVKWLRHRDME